MSEINGNKKQEEDSQQVREDLPQRCGSGQRLFPPGAWRIRLSGFRLVASLEDRPMERKATARTSSRRTRTPCTR